eukprot:g2048.t1
METREEKMKSVLLGRDERIEILVHEIDEKTKRDGQATEMGSCKTNADSTTTTVVKRFQTNAQLRTEIDILNMRRDTLDHRYRTREARLANEIDQEKHAWMRRVQLVEIDLRNQARAEKAHLIARHREYIAQTSHRSEEVERRRVQDVTQNRARTKRERECIVKKEAVVLDELERTRNLLLRETRLARRQDEMDSSTSTDLVAKEPWNALCQEKACLLEKLGAVEYDLETSEKARREAGEKNRQHCENLERAAKLDAQEFAEEMSALRASSKERERRANESILGEREALVSRCARLEKVESAILDRVAYFEAELTAERRFRSNVVETKVHCMREEHELLRQTHREDRARADASASSREAVFEKRTEALLEERETLLDRLNVSESTISMINESRRIATIERERRMLEDENARRADAAKLVAAERSLHIALREKAEAERDRADFCERLTIIQTCASTMAEEHRQACLEAGAAATRCRDESSDNALSEAAAMERRVATDAKDLKDLRARNEQLISCKKTWELEREALCDGKNTLEERFARLRSEHISKSEGIASLTKQLRDIERRTESERKKLRAESEALVGQMRALRGEAVAERAEILACNAALSDRLRKLRAETDAERDRLRFEHLDLSERAKTLEAEVSAEKCRFRAHDEAVAERWKQRCEDIIVSVRSEVDSSRRDVEQACRQRDEFREALESDDRSSVIQISELENTMTKMRRDMEDFRQRVEMSKRETAERAVSARERAKTAFETRLLSITANLENIATSKEEKCRTACEAELSRCVRLHAIETSQLEDATRVLVEERKQLLIRGNRLETENSELRASETELRAQVERSTGAGRAAVGAYNLHTVSIWAEANRRKRRIAELETALGESKRLVRSTEAQLEARSKAAVETRNDETRSSETQDRASTKRLESVEMLCRERSREVVEANERHEATEVFLRSQLASARTECVNLSAKRKRLDVTNRFEIEELQRRLAEATISALQSADERREFEVALALRTQERDDLGQRTRLVTEVRDRLESNLHRRRVRFEERERGFEMEINDLRQRDEVHGLNMKRMLESKDVGSHELDSFHEQAVVLWKEVSAKQEAIARLESTEMQHLGELSALRTELNESKAPGAEKGHEDLQTREPLGVLSSFFSF